MTFYSRQSYGQYRQNTRRAFGPQPSEAKFESFKAVQPTIAAWIEAKAATFDFAASLRFAVMKYGDLTPNQYEAVERCMGRDQERAQRAANAPQSVAVDASRIRASFEAARASGLRRPRVTIGGFEFSLAPDHGRNPGAIYVKDNGEYVGKVLGNDFQPARGFNPERAAALQSVFADPAAAARAHGLQTGECSCCGRTLTDPESVRRGIGPICEGRFGWRAF